MIALENQSVLEAIALLQQEARHLDRQEFELWLELFHKDCEYWVPMWKDADTLTNDPHSEMSHLFYPSRSGLEDRVLRIRSKRSPASVPMPRTVHLISGIAAEKPVNNVELAVSSNWVSHVFFPREKSQHAFFGYSEHLLTRSADSSWKIKKKRVVLQNDYIPSMLDIYCI